MLQSGQGRCEDITNLETYAMRAIGIATAADYTPWWAPPRQQPRVEGHARRAGPRLRQSNAHAAKVYRKTFAIQRDALAFRLPAGREAPNRFLASEFYVDVTDQYGPTTDVTVDLDARGRRGGALRLPVRVQRRRVARDPVGGRRGRTRHVRSSGPQLALPARRARRRAARPRRRAAAPAARRDGPAAGGRGRRRAGLADRAAPRPEEPGHGRDDAGVVPRGRQGVRAPALERCRRWVALEEFSATADAHRAALPASDSLYWLVGKDSRRLERPFVVEAGRQRWW